MSKRKKKWLSKQIAIYLATGILGVQAAFANPSLDNMTVVKGAATAVGNGKVATVTVGANGTVINWGSFSIAANETTAFKSDLSNYAVLNRVTGADLSNIAGTLSATSGGKIFLVNQNGIVLAGGAIINAPMFVASTINITDDAFYSYATNGGSLAFDLVNNTSAVNGGRSGGIGLNGTIAAAGNVTGIGSTVTVLPGVTYTGTAFSGEANGTPAPGGNLALVAAMNGTINGKYFGSNASKAYSGLNPVVSYTATKDNVVTVGDTTTGGATVSSGAVSLKGGAVNILGTGGSDSKPSVINGTVHGVSIEAVSTKTDSLPDGVNFTSHGTTDTGHSVIINHANLTSSDITIIGHDISINNTNLNTGMHVGLYAGNSLDGAENYTTTASSTVLAAGAANTITLEHSNINVNGDSADVEVNGGRITLLNTSLNGEADVQLMAGNNYTYNYDATAVGSPTTIHYTGTPDNSITIGTAAKPAKVAGKNVTIAGGAVIITGNSPTASTVSADSGITVYALNTLDETDTSNAGTKTLAATGANTIAIQYGAITGGTDTNNEGAIGLFAGKIDLSNSRLQASGFRRDAITVGALITTGSSVTADDLATYTVTSGTGSEINIKQSNFISPDVNIYGGSLAVDNTGFTINDSLGIYAAGTNYSTEKTHSSDTDKDETMKVTASAANTLDFTNDKIILSRFSPEQDINQDVQFVGGTVSLTNTDLNDAANGNADVLIAAGTAAEYAYTGHSLADYSLTAYSGGRDNTVTIGAATAPTALDGHNITVIGGAVNITGNSSTPAAVTADNQGSVSIYGLNSISPSGLTATPDNTVTIDKAKIETKRPTQAGGADIDIIGGKVSSSGNTITSASHLEVVSLSGRKTTASAADNNETTAITTGLGNDVNLAQTNLSALNIIAGGSTIALTGSTLTTGDNSSGAATDGNHSHIALYAGNSLTETDKNLDTTAKQTESLMVTASKENTVTVTDSGLTVGGGAQFAPTIEIVGGKVDLTGNTALTNNGTNNHSLFLVAGNKIDRVLTYDPQLPATDQEGLDDNNVTAYTGSTDNTVTIDAAVTLSAGPYLGIIANKVSNAGTITSTGSGEGIAIRALDSLERDLPAKTVTAVGSYSNNLTNSGTITGVNGPVLMSGGTISNTGTVKGTAATAGLNAWGRVTDQGTIDAPSYLVLSGNTVIAKTGDVTANTSEGVLTVTAVPFTYKVTTGEATIVTAVAVTGSAGTTVNISGQTKAPAPSTTPTGKADDQPVIQIYQITTRTTLPLTTPGNQTVGPQVTTGGSISGASLLPTGSFTTPADVNPPTMVIPSTTPGGTTVDLTPGVTMTPPAAAGNPPGTADAGPAPGSQTTGGTAPEAAGGAESASSVSE